MRGLAPWYYIAACDRWPIKLRLAAAAAADVAV